MNNSRLFLISMIFTIMVFPSFRWPVEKPRLTSSFAESRWDHFHDGIDVISSGDKVCPVKGGKLLYFWDKSIFPLDNYPGGGNYKIIKHEKGVYSVYMHLQDGQKYKKSFAEDDIVGIIGNTGHSFSKHLHFTLLDLNTGLSFNPLAVLSGIDDAKSPEVVEMALRIGDKYVILKDDSNIRLTRHYPLLIKIIDSISGGEKLGISKLKVSLNEKNIFFMDFNTITSSSKGFIAGRKYYEQLFDEKGYYKVEGITYEEGSNRIDISALDFYGNSVQKTYSFFVKLDMENK